MEAVEYLKKAIAASLDAGAAILRIYERDFTIETKADSSPLTEADKAAHHIIVDALEPTGIPVLSEESKAIAYDVRKEWKRYWLVDPLDGTKEFIKRNGEFTVNIALIENGRPVLGVVYAPVLRTIYYGSQAEGMAHPASPRLRRTSGAWKCTDCANKSVDEIMTSAVFLSPSSVLRPPSSALRVVASRSHCNEETQKFIEALEVQHGAVRLVSSGSSLKLCMVAEGSADVYPRIAPTMEWDTAAAQAVVEAAGGRVVKYNSAVPAIAYLTQSAERRAQSGEAAPCPMLHALCYNKPDLLNPFFVVLL